jgi:Fe-S-cluster-containing dehydrogenase component/anaerobic selenocysteine-containing dehydrogenase
MSSMNNDLRQDGFVPLEALTGKPARRYWRTLEEYGARTREIAEDDCDGENSSLDDVSRRRFLELAAASFAFAGVTGCTRQPAEKILPYVIPPENVTPGRPKYYATAIPFAGMAQGVIVESHLGRPTKVEGNPAHPASLGASSVHSQASVLDLYDPDRATVILNNGEQRSWDEFRIALTNHLAPIQAKGGTGLHILTGTVTSPVLGAQVQGVLKALPNAKWHQWDAAGPHSARAGAELAFGRPVNTYYRFDQADVVLSLDADFLSCGEPSTRYAHDFANRRTRGDRMEMNRLYVVESTMTATGGKADHRLPLQYAEIESFARNLASAVGIAGVTGWGGGRYSEWVKACAKDLSSHRGACVVIPGSHQSPAVHALAHAMNVQLGNVGKTVAYTDPLEQNPVDEVGAIRELAQVLNSGSVDLLLILGGNPAYDAPIDLGFPELLRRAKTSIYVSLHPNETADGCAWLVPESHALESWGDARAFDGTVSIMQPLIDPLYESHSHIEVLDLILNKPGRSGYDIVRAYWQAKSGSKDFESWWRKSVCDGVVENSALAEITAKLSENWAQSLQERSNQEGLEIVFRPDVYMYDGRFANNTWLQELPQPMTKLTWDNAVYLSPATAKKLGVSAQERVQLVLRGRSIEGSVWILPGQPDDSVTVHLGWGRTRSGRAGNGAGFNAYAVRSSDALWSASGVQAKGIGSNYPLATTQMVESMEGRALMISDTVDRYRREPDFVKKETKDPPRGLTLYPTWNYTGHAWGMSIDLTRCVNCNACVVACQAENNIPVVGKDQVLNHRAMHWLRIDAYFEGDLANPRAMYLPVPCMQCEDAPCELVCPVQATNHSVDGLNDMVYNRCIGTRYCSNNCPYKVRRFNFMLYQDWLTESIKLQRNPDVSVRSRGVMEKCTYCVQRIREAEIYAQVDDKGLPDGSIQTACQQSCPTQAIIFGDLNQSDSKVRKLKSEKLDYELLGELNTRPRTTYLAELRNPNPEMKEA